MSNIASISLADSLAPRFEQANRDAINGCGLSDVLYTDRYSDAVDEIISRLPKEQQTEAYTIAREHGDYATSEEREAAHERIAENGDCPLTGIEPDYCPCGRHL